jgi:CO dehydrogenase/acetyl-CoA synthase delta subunit
MSNKELEMTSEEIKDLVKFMKAEGVASFEVADIKISFDPRGFAPAMKFNNLEELKQSIAAIKDEQDKARQEEEDLLFASAT